MANLDAVCRRAGAYQPVEKPRRTENVPGRLISARSKLNGDTAYAL